MKKFITAFMLMAIMAIVLPIAADAQTTTTRKVSRNGRTTVRVVTKTNRGHHYGWRNRRNRTPMVTSQEQRRLDRQRSRLSRYGNRINRDGMVTNKEAGKYDKRVNKYERKVNKARNN